MPIHILHSKNFVFTLLFCFCTPIIQAQTADHSLSILSFATLHQNDARNTPFDVFINPATAAFYKGFAVGVCSEQKWQQRDIISADISAVWATKNGTWALPVHIDKAGSFSSSTPSIIYARKLASTVGLSLQLGYNMQQVEKYGSQHQLDTKLGFMVHVTPQLHMGATMHNAQLWFKQEKLAVNMPVSIACQTAYEPSEIVLLQAIVEKQQNKATQIIAGIYYRCHKYVEVSGGINTEGHQFWGGGSLIWKSFRLGISAIIHPQLGVTPGLMFIYNTEKKL